jgi:predicted outer membrane repeat protein
MAFSNVTFSDNEATIDGGGIYVCSTGELHLANVTISDNRADSDDDLSGNGGGIYLDTYDQDSGIVHVKNSIIADNADLSDWPGIAAHDCFGEVTSEGYSLIGTLGYSLPDPPCSITGDETGNLIEEDAMLDVLADNDGPTLTHALLPGSPAINAGNPGICRDNFSNLLMTDQRGGFRPDRCDMGAFEFGALTEPIYLPIVQNP